MVAKKSFAAMKPVVTYIVLFSVLCFASVCFVVVLRTLTLPKPHIPEPCLTSDSDYIHDSFGLSKRLSQALTFQTVSWAPGKGSPQELKRFIQFLKTNFPRVHSSSLVHLEMINGLSLLYLINGSDPSLKPYMLAGHLDVVPAEPEMWEVPPFSGKIKDGYIYGRGAIDAKNIVMGLLESLEFLLIKGFRPKRSFYFAFGHDEEVGGSDGAAKVAETLKARGVQLEFLLDEGSMVLNRSIPGVHLPIAFVSVTEKGYLTIRLSVNGTPGHSSIPPAETPIVTLAKAVSKLDSFSQPNLFGKGPERDMLEHTAPYASFPFKVVYANLWLFTYAVSWIMSWVPLTNAMVRTSTAVTVIIGGSKENVLPSSASAVVNHRIHPAQTIEQVINRDKSLINNDMVTIQEEHSFNPHPVSPYGPETFGHQVISNSIHQVFREVVVVPSVLIGNTDTRWYLPLTECIYRFAPTNLLVEETKRFHGNNECISVRNYEQTVNFYYHLIVNSDNKKLPKRNAKTEL